MSAEKFEHHVAQALEISRAMSWPFAAIGLRPSADESFVGATVALNLDPHNPIMGNLVASSKSYGLALVGAAKMIGAAKEDAKEKVNLDSGEISESMEDVVNDMLGPMHVEPEAPVPVEQVVIDELSALVMRLGELCKEHHLPVACSVLFPVLHQSTVEIAELQVLGYPLDDPKTLGILMSSVQGVALVSAAHTLGVSTEAHKASETSSAGDSAPGTPDAATAPAEPGEQG